MPVYATGLTYRPKRPKRPIRPKRPLFATGGLGNTNFVISYTGQPVCEIPQYQIVDADVVVVVVVADVVVVAYVVVVADVVVVVVVKALTTV